MENEIRKAARTIELMRRLIHLNFSTRDELCAAADKLTDEELRHVCHRLADELGGNAADLQQRLIAKGATPADEPRDDVDEKLREITVDMLHRRWGRQAVLGHAKAAEQRLKENYNQTLDALPRPSGELGDALRSQRDGIEFGEWVLDRIQTRRAPPSSDPFEQ